MTTFLLILAALLGLLGLIGAVLPILPGTVLSYLGLLCAALVAESTLSASTLLVWAAVSALVIVSDYFLPGYFSKLCGGTKAGITGATVGAILGIFVLGFLGVVLGPFIGAVVGEMVSGKLPFREALVVGFGALMSFFVGTGIKLVVGIWMFYLIVVEILEVLKVLSVG